MAKRRRRRRGVWFPNLGTEGNEAELDDDDYGFFADISPIPPDGSSITLVTDLTFDQPIEDQAISQGPTARSLADIIGSEYILRRIVGNLFLTADQSGAADAFNALLVTAGFFVARAEDSSTEAVDVSLPIGTETALETRENYSPAVVSTIREPWIWRRRWILGNQSKLFGGFADNGVLAFPITNVDYGTSLTGPYIDAHTVRRVSQDDRLFFSLSVRQMGAVFSQPFNPFGVEGNARLSIHLDYRLFGMLTKAKAKGSF